MKKCKNCKYYILDESLAERICHNEESPFLYSENYDVEECEQWEGK